MTYHALLSASTFYTITKYIKVASWVKGVGEQGQPSEKWFITLSSFTVYDKEDFTLSLKHQLYVCICGYTCCQTGIELSKCVYLASMGVKINHTVGSQNQECFFKMHI